ncbi:MAG: Bug family tripartite tricarboxylate transporter substrate binding protein [Syntrophales bacterium]
MKSVKAVAAIVVFLLVSGMASAQNYPTKPVRMIVPFAPGGASDVVARILSPVLGKELGQTILVDNRSGASGNIGVAASAQAPADGYTILLGNIGTMAINPGLFPKFNVSPVRDFVAITQVVDVPTALAIHPSVPVKNVKEFIDYAKARPGKLNFGTAGPGSNGRLEMEMFMRAAGINLVQIPYKGGAGAAAIGLLGGEVHCAFVTLASIMTHINSGKVKVLAVAAPRRISSIPDVPNFPEIGYKGMKSGSWQGVYAPKGTPDAIVKKLHAAFVKVMADPGVVKRLQDSGAEVVTSKSPAEFAEFMKEENEKWTKVIKEVGVVMQ